MAKISRLLARAARQIALNPRVRAKATEVFEKEVKPRAKEAWRQSKPKLDAAKAELREMARETDARKHPGKFAAKVKERLLKRQKPSAPRS